MQNASYYKDQAFREKVLFYLVKAAIAVMAEDASVDYHAQRVDFARQVLCNGASLDMYSLGVLANPTIKGKVDAGESYNSDLEFVVNSLFTAYAGGSNIST